MQRYGIYLALGVALSLCSCRGCGARGGLPPARPHAVTEADGVTRYRVDKGDVQAYYDRWGRLERIETDSNGDGKRDRISHHAGKKNPGLVEIDTDFDNRVDRWEYYDDSGRLLRIGVSRGGGTPDMWQILDGQGRVLRREYDDDRDGKLDRVESLENDRVTRTEVDSDRDGRIDRWQTWAQGRLVSENLDTDGDGRADRVVLYDSDGKVNGMRRLPAR
jgi:hypothetical protein